MDSHVHVWELPSGRYPWNPLLAEVPDAAAPVDALVSQLDRNRIHAAILVQPSLYGWDHSLLFDSMANFPGRLAGVALLDHQAPDWRRQLDRLLQRGARGIRFNLQTSTGRPWIAETAYSALWAELSGRGIPACFHARPDQLSAIDNLAERHPALTIVVDHLGRPIRTAAGWDWRAVVPLARRPRVFVKVSGLQACGPPATWSHLGEVLLGLAETFGCERLMWGSDAPSSLTGGATYEETLAPVRSLGLGAADRQRILGGTALAVFGVPLTP